MHFGIISIFPEMFSSLSVGITGKALARQQISLHFFNPREEVTDKRRRIDDRPYGGGPGMVMMAPPLQASIEHARQQLGEQTKVVYLSPQGQVLTQPAINRFASLKGLILLSGRYVGIDERIMTHSVDEEWSLGDYVISGGELASMVLIDAICRQLPDTLGHEDSARLDSFNQTLLDHPHYTRPKVFLGQAVPNILLSGDHQAIDAFRRREALKQTCCKRKDLLDHVVLCNEEKQWLEAYLTEIED